MNFEIFKRNHLKRNVIIGIVVVLVISAIILNFTRAKYRVTQSIPLVNGTINYSLADLNIVAIYTNMDNGYTEVENIPESGYVLNEEESYCTVNNERDDSITLSYDLNTKALSLTPMTTKGTKCYLYFDKSVSKSMQEILASYDKSTRSSFNTIFTEETKNRVFSAIDWKGISYYFAGNPTDNWVNFGGFYWRIIRMNGDGSTRLIYNGTSTISTGTETMISTSQVFNTNSNFSFYVGLSYSTTQHGTGTKSNILTELDSWYNSSELSSTTNSKYIDSSIGFCSDRNMASGYSWVDRDKIYYAAYERLEKNKNPSLSCNSSDILQIPIGLITVDEVAYAGGVFGVDNDNYYLYNNQNYFTMSPYSFSGSRPIIFNLNSSGRFYYVYVTSTSGTRPVINLKSDTRFEGSGTAADPFIVVE